MSTTTRWTSEDLKSLPDDGSRYEIIDGELYTCLSESLRINKAKANIIIGAKVWRRC